jgi:hypothetical protein
MYTRGWQWGGTLTPSPLTMFWAPDSRVLGLQWVADLFYLLQGRNAGFGVPKKRKKGKRNGENSLLLETYGNYAWWRHRIKINAVRCEGASSARPYSQVGMKREDTCLLSFPFWVWSSILRFQLSSLHGKRRNIGVVLLDRDAYLVLRVVGNVGGAVKEIAYTVAAVWLYHTQPAVWFYHTQSAGWLYHTQPAVWLYHTQPAVHFTPLNLQKILPHSTCSKTLPHSICRMTLPHSTCKMTLPNSTCSRFYHAQPAVWLGHTPSAVWLLPHSTCSMALIHSIYSMTLPHSTCNPDAMHVD